MARCARAAAGARQGTAPPPLETRLGFLREQKRPLPRVEAKRGEGGGLLREQVAGGASSEGGAGGGGAGGARETTTG